MFCRWSAIAAKLPGRSDNEIKNHWHTHLKKRAPEHVPDVPRKEEPSFGEQIMQFNIQPSSSSNNIISNELISSYIVSNMASQRVSDDSSSSFSGLERRFLIDLNQEYVEEE